MKHLKKLTLTLVALFALTAGAQAMMALVGVHDDIEDKDLTAITDYTIDIYAVNDEGEKTGEPIAYTSLTPGRYLAVAKAKDSSKSITVTVSYGKITLDTDDLVSQSEAE